jgi:hypothetical protein
VISISNTLPRRATGISRLLSIQIGQQPYC